MAIMQLNYASVTSCSRLQASSPDCARGGKNRTSHKWSRNVQKSVENDFEVYLYVRFDQNPRDSSLKNSLETPKIQTPQNKNLVATQLLCSFSWPHCADERHSHLDSSRRSHNFNLTTNLCEGCTSQTTTCVSASAQKDT